MNRQIAIVQVGTFDIANYGDSLFPLILQYRLSDLAPSLICASPRGGEPVWTDSRRSVAIETITDRSVSVDMLVLGGGHLLHGDPSHVDYYDAGGLTGYLAYPRLWLGVAHYAARLGVPLVWNAPGVPVPFADGAARCVTWAAAQSRYVSVRDRRSATLLHSAGFEGEVAVVPDPGLDVSELWSRDELEQEREEAFANAGSPVPARTIAFHLNSRYLDGKEGDLAGRLDAICRSADATGILLALGPCHGDDTLQRSIGRLMKTKPLIVDRPKSLRHAAALIAGSDGYLGSSLHGLITACSFGVRAAAVASERACGGKFSGFLEQFGLERWLLGSWRAAQAEIDEFLGADCGAWQRVLTDARPVLAEHWDRIRAALPKAMGASPTSHRRGTSRTNRDPYEMYEPIISDAFRAMSADIRRGKATLLQGRARIRDLNRTLESTRTKLQQANTALARDGARLRALKAAIVARDERIARLSEKLIAEQETTVGLKAEFALLRGEVDRQLASEIRPPSLWVGVLVRCSEGVGWIRPKTLSGFLSRCVNRIFPRSP